MSANKDEIRKELENLREDAKKIKTDISSLFEKLVEIGKSESAIDDEIREEGRKLIEDLNQMMDSTPEENNADNGSPINEITDNVTEKFSKNPVMTLFVAFVAGLIFGKWTSR